MPDWFSGLIAIPILGTALQLLLLLLLFLLVRRAVRLAARQVEQRLIGPATDLERRERLKTLLRVSYHAAMIVLVVVALFMALSLLNLNITPLLASAGVVGLAISLGAQSLIRDYIGGILILVEDQFRLGDVVEVAGKSGEVVRITLRATYLRDVEGKLHIVPNGEMRVLTNVTRDWSRAVVDLNLDFDANIGQVTRALEKAIALTQGDRAVREALLEPPQIVSWNGLSDWAIQVRLMAKTVPGKQWEVARVLRRCALEALQAEGIRVALPVAGGRAGSDSQGL